MWKYGDRRPSLIRQENLLGEGGSAVPVPNYADYLFAVMLHGEDGTSATVHFVFHQIANHPTLPPLVLLDFEVGHYDGGTISRMYGRQEELARLITHVGERKSYVQEHMLMQAHLQGWRNPPITIPEELLRDPTVLAMSAAGHVVEGRMKIAEPAAERSKTYPLAGALDFSIHPPVAAWRWYDRARLRSSL